MKKTVAIILIMLVAMTCVLAFAGCNNDDGEDYGDNYIGAISKTAYDSIEDTAKRFLIEEIFVDFILKGIDDIYQRYTKAFDLPIEEIDKLSIGAELKDGIISIEKGVVEYLAPNFSESPVFCTIPKEREIYIIAYELNSEIKYRYYVLADKVGETLTASALASLLDTDKYINSTFSWITKYGVAISIQQYTYNSIYCRYIEDTYSDNASVNEEYIFIYDDTVYRVFGNVGGNLFVYKQNDLSPNGSSMKDDIFIKELGTVMMYNRLIFTKTDTGYQSSGIESVVSEYNNINIKVSNGRITEIAQGNDFEYKLVISDFGTTKIDIPKYVIDAVKAYIAEN